MRTILKYNEYLNMDKKEYEFRYGEAVKMNIVDSSGENVKLDTELVEIGCSADRRNIYQKFKVTKTNSDKYPIDMILVFPMEFNKKDFSFLVEIPYKYSSGGSGSLIEKHYKAYVELG